MWPILPSSILPPCSCDLGISPRVTISSQAKLPDSKLKSRLTLFPPPLSSNLCHLFASQDPYFPGLRTTLLVGSKGLSWMESHPRFLLASPTSPPYVGAQLTDLFHTQLPLKCPFYDIAAQMVNCAFQLKPSLHPKHLATVTN